MDREAGRGGLCLLRSQVADLNEKRGFREVGEQVYDSGQYKLILPSKGEVMTLQADELLSTVAQELHISEEDLVRQGMRSILERQLREVKAEMFAISGRYSVSSVEEMEARYQDGTLEEADSWRDLQRLDHLEHRRDRLLQLLKALT